MSSLSPAFARNGSITLLPGPITRFRIQDSWDFETSKVPLQDGEVTSGHSRNSLELTINGELAQQNTTLFLSELQMLDALQSLRTALHTSYTDPPLTVFLIHDPDNGNFRFFENCTAARIIFDLSSPHLYSYQLTLIIDDPTLKSEWPAV